MAITISKLAQKLTIQELRELGNPVRELDRELRKYEKRLTQAREAHYMRRGDDAPDPVELSEAIAAIEAVAQLRYRLSEAWEQATSCPESHDPFYGTHRCPDCS